MIEINNVTKILGGREILKDINLGVTKGKVFGLIGENGAGKTTLIKCLTGIFLPDQGSIKILGEEVYDNLKVKEQIGYVADQNKFFPDMKIKELLRFYQFTYPKFSIDRFVQINEILELDIQKSVKKLSKGMQTRLSLVLNLSIFPEVLILDEPTSGLDPLVKRQITNLLLEEVEKRGVTIFISSHHLSDLERICDNIAIIRRGKIQYHNSLEAMKRNVRKLQVAFQEAAPSNLKEWPGVMAVEQLGKVYQLVIKDHVQEFEAKLQQYQLLLLEEVDLSLEDMYIYSAGEGLKNDKVLV
ncbi:MAG: ABC transporter ATP-binding protein [Bacillota bacterium]